MKRLIAVFRRDVVASRRDPMVLMLLGTSLLFAFLLRAFVGGFEQAGATLAVSRADATAVERALSHAVDVVVVADDAAVRRAVEKTGGVMGVTRVGTGFRLVLAGDEPEEVRALGQGAVDSLADDSGPVTIVSVGAAQKPLLSWLAVFYCVAAVFLGGAVMAFNIVEDKEMRTMQALGTTPLSQSEYVGARSVMVLLLGLGFGFVSLAVIGAAFDPGATAVLLLAGVPFGVVAGFVLGAVSGNVVQVIANLKLAWLLMLLPGMATWFLPEKLEYALAPLPQFWLFKAFARVLVDDGGMADIALPAVMLLITTTAVAAFGFPLLRRRLSFSTA